MKELWLNFENESGDSKRILVEQDSFVVGRHSGNDLNVASGKLSREHAKIDCFGDVYILSDLDSSNGTMLNGSAIDEPSSLEDGDSIDFGGGLQVSVEIVSDEPNYEESEDHEGTAVAASAGSTGGGSNLTTFFLLAPILGLMFLLCAGGGLYFAYSDGSGGGEDLAESNDYDISTPDNADDDDDTGKTDDTPKPDDTTTPQDLPEGNSEIPDELPINTDEPPDVPAPSNDLDKARKFSASFLPRIAGSEPNAFLLDRNLQKLMPKIGQFKSSAALASNLKQANQKSSEIKSIAGANGLKPQFLAAAALAKIGNRTGDVVATAKSMAGILQKLQVQIGSELADESTLIVAAYYQGEAGKFSQMKTTTEVLAGKNTGGGATARQVRTIWFLKDQGKLNANEYDLALQFLAIGTIMQKPSEFSVNAEPVLLN